MIEIDRYELEVLKRLLYPETLATLVEEGVANDYITADCLRSLMHKKLISPMLREEKSGRFKRVFIYDSDNLHRYYFQITSKGLELTGNKGK